MEAAKSVGTGHAVHSEQHCPQLTSVLRCRHESDTTDLYCIFNPDSAQAGWWGTGLEGE